jgi:hemolysin III
MQLLAGGLLYSFGAVCYTLKRPDPFPGFFGFHEVWHLFVMAGSLAHFVMVYNLPLQMTA